MLARLAFSVATVIRPEIMIVDEILSVGDDRFQKKSGAKMMEIMNGGSTIILVSHSMDDVRELCNKVMWLDKGEIRSAGTAKEVCDAYESR